MLQNLPYLRKSLLVILLSAISISSYAQLYENKPPKEIINNQNFLGFGIGFNEYGLGGSFEFALTEKVAGFGNVGIGLWGYKLGAGVSIYPKGEPYGSSFSFGYAHATGLDEVEAEMQIEPNDQTETVLMNLEDCGTFNIVYSYNFKVGQKNKFALSAGYAIPLQEAPYTIQTPGIELNDISEKVMEFMQPGGLIFGLKFMFGL